MLSRAQSSPLRAPLRVALLCSQRAPGLAHLLEGDDRMGSDYRLAGCITSEPECRERERFASAGIPLVLHDLRAFCAERNASVRDMDVRREFDRGMLKTLAEFDAELVVLCGYLYIVTGPLLNAYPGRVVNIHDSDLCVTDSSGRPKYRGLHAVREAIFAGANETRSTVHAVTEEVDVGPAILRSWPFEVHRELVAAARRAGAADVLRAYAYAQREWMMGSCWGPLLAHTVRLFARGQVEVADRSALVLARPGPHDLSRESTMGANRPPLPDTAVGG